MAPASRRPSRRRSLADSGWGGRKREAYELLKKVSRLGGGNLTGDGRTISGSLGFFAESFGEYDKAQVYFSDALQCWPSNNDKWYPLYKQCLIRVTKKAREMNASKLIEEVPGAEANAGGITLDEKF